jgi:hypothetical protein
LQRGIEDQRKGEKRDWGRLVGREKVGGNVEGKGLEVGCI